MHWFWRATIGATFGAACLFFILTCIQSTGPLREHDVNLLVAVLCVPPCLISAGVFQCIRPLTRWFLVAALPATLAGIGCVLLELRLYWAFAGIDIHDPGMAMQVASLLYVLPGLVSLGVFNAASERKHLSEKNRCCECGYDLTGNVTGVCSECGTEVPGQGKP